MTNEQEALVVRRAVAFFGSSIRRYMKSDEKAQLLESKALSLAMIVKYLQEVEEAARTKHHMTLMHNYLDADDE